MSKPVWLLDIDGVVNAIGKGDPSVWPKPQWRHGKAECDGQEWPITWAVPVVDFIRTVHESGRAEIRWHTTWQHEACNLAALVGLPEFAVADAPEFDDQPGHAARAIAAGRPKWWKLPAAERVVRDEGRPLIWTDDDITWDLGRRYDVDTELRAFAPALLIAPDKHTGLTPKRLRMIGDFLDIHSPIEVTA